MKNLNVIIIRGCQGSGKSTLANLIALYSGALVCEADKHMYDENGNYDFHYSKLQDCHNKCFEEFKSGIDSKLEMIIVSNVGALWKHCEEYYNYAKQNGYNVTSIIVENRNETNNVHNVDSKIVENVKNKFEIKLI